MEIHEKRRAFHTLDGIRGIAALIVVLFHIGPFYGLPMPPETFLAVDLFFLLSGFVVAYAYEHRLERGGFLSEFVKIRLIRLYPLYILGLLIACVLPVLQIIHGGGQWTALRLAEQVGLDLFMLGGVLNTPTWTLAPELLANLLYGVFIKRLTAPILIGITIIGAVILTYWERQYQTVNAGWAHHYLPAISRATFSFFFGVLLQKVIGDRRKVRNWVAWGSLVAAGALLAFYPPKAEQQYYELALVLVAFPALVAVACMSEPGPKSGRVFRFLGLVSYAVYALHEPIAAVIRHILSRVAHLDEATAHAVAGFGFMAAIVLIAWLADEFYDAPVRRWLARILTSSAAIRIKDGAP